MMSYDKNSSCPVASSLLEVDDPGELLADQAGTAHQSPVDIRASHELIHGLRSYRATVLDDDIVSHGRAIGLLEPGADVGVHVLGDLGGGGEAGADGPHGLVGNDNLGPVADLVGAGLQQNKGKGEQQWSESVAAAAATAAILFSVVRERVKMPVSLSLRNTRRMLVQHSHGLLE